MDVSAFAMLSTGLAKPMVPIRQMHDNGHTIVADSIDKFWNRVQNGTVKEVDRSDLPYDADVDSSSDYDDYDPSAYALADEVNVEGSDVDECYFDKSNK